MAVGTGPVAAEALKASYPKPGLTATCWAEPTPPPVQGLILKDHCPGQHEKLLPKYFPIFKVWIQRMEEVLERNKMARQFIWLLPRERKGSKRGGICQMIQLWKMVWSILTYVYACLWVWGRERERDCTFSSNGRQRGTLCSSLTIAIKSLSCRSSSLVLQRDRGWYCENTKTQRLKYKIISHKNRNISHCRCPRWDHLTGWKTEGYDPQRCIVIWKRECLKMTSLKS